MVYEVFELDAVCTIYNDNICTVHPARTYIESIFPIFFLSFLYPENKVFILHFRLRACFHFVKFSYYSLVTFTSVRFTCIIEWKIFPPL